MAERTALVKRLAIEYVEEHDRIQVGGKPPESVLSVEVEPKQLFGEHKNTFVCWVREQYYNLWRIHTLDVNVIESIVKVREAPYFG